MFFKIQNPKVPRKPLQKCTQFIASSSQNSQKARGKIASTSAVKKTPQDKNSKWQKRFGWTLRTMKKFKGVRLQRIEIHQSEKGILIACFLRGQLMLNYCFVIGPSILLFLHILLTETFSKFVDNFTTSVFQMPKSIKSLPSCYFKIKFHFSTGSPQDFFSKK